MGIVYDNLSHLSIQTNQNCVQSIYRMIPTHWFKFEYTKKWKTATPPKGLSDAFRMCFWPCHSSCGSGPSGKYAKRPWHMEKTRRKKKKRLEWSTYGEVIENKQLKPSTSFFSPPDISDVENLNKLFRDILHYFLQGFHQSGRQHIPAVPKNNKGHENSVLSSKSCTKWYRWAPLIDLIKLKLPIIKWFIPGVYLSPLWMTPEFGKLTFQKTWYKPPNRSPSASVDCSYHWSRLSKRCERQSLKCNVENRARWSSNKYTYAMAMYYRLKIID